jgi:hypothetical protein
VFIHGEEDGIDIDVGYAAVRVKLPVSSEISKDERQIDYGSRRVLIIGKAGYYVHLHPQFNEIVEEEMRSVSTLH